MDAITQVPMPANEPVHDYAPQSAERTRLLAELAALADNPIDLPHVIGGIHRMGVGERIDVVQPHRHAARLGTFTNAEHADASAAIEAAIAGRSCPTDIGISRRRWRSVAITVSGICSAEKSAGTSSGKNCAQNFSASI